MLTRIQYEVIILSHNDDFSISFLTRIQYEVIFTYHTVLIISFDSYSVRGDIYISHNFSYKFLTRI